MSPAGPQTDSWRWQDTKYKILVPILPPFPSQSFTWRLPRLPLVIWLLWALVRIVTFLFAGITLDMAQVLGFVLILLCYLGGIDPSSWMTSMTTALIFVRDLGLRLISGRGIMGLSLFFVLRSLITVLPINVLQVFLGRQAMAFWVPDINLPSPGGWL